MKRFSVLVWSFMVLLLSSPVVSCGNNQDELKTNSTWVMMNNPKKTTTMNSMEKATFGTGCFWCTEAQFEMLQGVSTVVSGYSGGETKNPTYREVCSGRTGHAEVVQVTYDPSIISYEELLAAFFMMHDPTTLNRQGADVGTQYRSAIFYHTKEQQEKAEYYKNKLNQEQAYDSPIITEISAFSHFYKAEETHQEYYRLNKNEPYCMMVIQPKLEKFKKVFAEKLKD